MINTIMRLFEVIQLLEYNKGATLNNWGERIAQAAKFNRKYLSDQFFNNFDGEMEYEGHDPEDDGDIANVVLMNLERMDPTPNKQYVMTLIRWYIGNSKKFKQLQQDYTEWRRDTNFDIYGEYDHPDSHYPEDIQDLADFADEFDDFENDMSNYTMEPENLNTFKLEDADQIRDALETYHRMKPQLQPNERDIGRFKSFHRFEDFVDSKNSFDTDDGEIKDEINRSDVEVLYNGPLGTVTIPKSEEASCLLGKGTKWCTASTGGDNWFDHYNKRGDLIIYNEKPGNAKYQIHVTMKGLEARDARDRLIPHAKEVEFTRNHPVISKIIQAQHEKIFAIAAQQPWTTDAITSDGGDPTRLVRDFINFNNKHQGGVMRYVDEYYTKFALPSILDSKVTIPNREMVDLMLTYAEQRGKPWPEMMDLMIQILRKAADSADLSSNIELKSINRLVAQLDTQGSNPKLEQFKADMIDKLKDKQAFESNSMDEMRRLINIMESDQHEQLDEFDLKKAAATAMAVGALAGGVGANDITYDDLFNKHYSAEIEKMEQRGYNLTDRNADGYNPSLKRSAKRIAELKAKQEYSKLSPADSPIAKEIEKTRTELPQSKPKPDLPDPDLNKYIPSNMGRP